MNFDPDGLHHILPMAEFSSSDGLSIASFAASSPMGTLDSTPPKSSLSMYTKAPRPKHTAPNI